MKPYKFIGGSLDGQTIVLDEKTKTYVVQHMKYFNYSDFPLEPELQIPIEEEEYCQRKIGSIEFFAITGFSQDRTVELLLKSYKPRKRRNK